MAKLYRPRTRGGDDELATALHSLERALEEHVDLLRALAKAADGDSFGLHDKAHTWRTRRGDSIFEADEPYIYMPFPGAGGGSTPATSDREDDVYRGPEKFPDSGPGKAMFGGRLDGRRLGPRRKRGPRLL